MTKKTSYLFIPFITVFTLLLTTCGSSSNSGNILKDLAQPMPVYNQAYQENYDSDTIPEIETKAKNAYVLLDTFADDVSQHISKIKQNGNQVGGYISAGTGENWRADFDVLKPYLTPVSWSEWPGEYFVNETTTGILSIMKARINKMAKAGVDWVEFDNMDWLDKENRNTYHLAATVSEAKAYINALCEYTHLKKMKCMAKNTVNGFKNFDGVLYESYHDDKNWWDNEGTKSFLQAHKPVIINHYNETNCDAVYSDYKSIYQSEKISFICENIAIEKYKHYNQ